MAHMFIIYFDGANIFCTHCVNDNAVPDTNLLLCTLFKFFGRRGLCGCGVAGLRFLSFHFCVSWYGLIYERQHSFDLGPVSTFLETLIFGITKHTPVIFAAVAIIEI